MKSASELGAFSRGLVRAARLFFRPDESPAADPDQPQLQKKFPRQAKSSTSWTSTNIMKIKALSRSAESAQAPGSNVQKLTRNLNPEIHPFERAREYTRALNATKLERMFAQPFLGSFEPGHVDGVYSLAKDPESLEHLASGSGDGIIKGGFRRRTRDGHTANCR